MAEIAQKKDPSLKAYHEVLFDLISKKYGIDFNDAATVNKAIAGINGNLSQETGNRPNAEEDMRKDKAAIRNIFELIRGNDPNSSKYRIQPGAREGGPSIFDAPDYSTIPGYR